MKEFEGANSMQKGTIAVGCALVAVALLSFAAPAAAQTPGSWTLDCKGNFGGASVSLQWHDNGVLLATGAGSCSLTGTLSGFSAPPANANLLVVTLTVSAYSSSHSRTDSISIIPGQAFTVHLSASAHGASIEPSPTCKYFCIDLTPHEHARFSFDG